MAIQVSTHFTMEELACSCGCGLMPNYDLILRLEFVRSVYDSPIVIASAARCPKYNKKIGGAEDSAHTRATAIDPSAPRGEDLFKMIQAFLAAGFYGFGMGKRPSDGVYLLHFDRDEKYGPRSWMY